MSEFIRELPCDYRTKTSFAYNSNFLWTNENIYIMDNHLSAAWCWLQKCDIQEKYNFMHIDRHDDLALCLNCEEIFNLHTIDNSLTYDEFTNLKRADGEFKMFRWDNYIRIMCSLFPDWFINNFFITMGEKKGINYCHSDEKFIYRENLISILDVLHQYLLEPSPNLSFYNKPSDVKLKWILNFDLDVFFSENNDHILVFSDSYIRSIAKIIHEAMPSIAVFTIAISPECLAGGDIKGKWNTGMSIIKLMSEEIPELQSFVNQLLKNNL